MVPETRETLSESFKHEALAFLDDLRTNETITDSDWLEEVIPTLTHTEKRHIYEAYAAGTLSEGAAHVLLGDALYAVEDEITTMKDALETDTTAVLANRSPAMADIASL